MSVTTKDIAEYLGINRSSVSRALQGKIVSAQTIERVRQAARELGYRPNLGARIMVSGRTGMVGLLLPNLENPFFSTLAQRMQRKALERSHFLCLATYDNDADECRKFLELMVRDRRVDGLIVASIQDSRLREMITSAANEDIPIVLMDHSYHERIHCVLSDLGQGRYQLVRHLLELGHTRIGMIFDFAGLAPDRLAPELALHLHEASQIFHEHGLEFPAELLAGCPSNYADAYAAARAMLTRPDRPTALCAGNDMVAVATIAAAGSLGLRIPEDLSLTGFDNVELAKIFDLTTVENIPDEFIEAPVNIIQRVLTEGFEQTGKLTMKITPRLIVRGSTRPPRA